MQRGWLQQVKKWGTLRLRAINIRASGIKFQRNEESLPDRIMQTEREGNKFPHCEVASFFVEEMESRSAGRGFTALFTLNIAYI
jgi:hypothetical protein